MGVQRAKGTIAKRERLNRPSNTGSSEKSSGEFGKYRGHRYTYADEKIDVTSVTSLLWFLVAEKKRQGSCFARSERDEGRTFSVGRAIDTST